MNDEMDNQKTFAEQETTTYETSGSTAENGGTQQTYGEDLYKYGTFSETVNEEPGGNGFGIASLVLGIISLILFCTCCNILFAILAIVFGIIQLVRGKGNGKGLAIGGLITSALSIIFCIIFWVVMASYGTFTGVDSYLDYYEQLYPGIFNDSGDNYTNDYDFDYDDIVEKYNDDTF